MSQPPYPPPGGSEPAQPGEWPPPSGGADEPTQQFGAPAQPQREQTRQFGQPQFGQQPPYGQQPPQPAYGQQPPAQPPYGQPPQYGQQPPYGQPPQYGQQPYGPPSQYGQPPYGQQPYGPPGAPWAPPGQQPKRSSTLIALIIAGVVVVAAIGVALFLVLRTNDPTDTAVSATDSAIATPSERTSPSGSSSGSSSRSSSSPSSRPSSSGSSGIPPAGDTPDGLGDDPVLDQYAQSCFGGDMTACDTLYNESEIGSDYETYGGTCGGRQPATNSDVVYCTDAFPG